MTAAKWIWLVLLSAFLVSPSRAQIVVNEILADNKTIAPLPNNPDYFPDYVELYNSSGFDIDLGISEWKIGDSRTNYNFTPGTVIPAGGYLLVFCDDDLTVPGVHTGFGLNSTKGETVYLYSGFTVTEFHTFGIQAPDLSLGRIPNATGSMQLNTPTPGDTNAPAMAPGNRFTLKINEWLATNSAGSDKDWFEIYNPDSNVVDLAGIVFADRGSSNRVGSVAPLRGVPPLSYIAPFGFVQIFASDKDNDADEVDFSLSSSNGDDIWMFVGNSPTGVVDVVRFGPQTGDISEGRLPDGGAYIDSTGTNNIRLKSPSPRDSNFGPIPEVVINEALAHVDLPLEDAIELHNPNSTNVDVGGWWLSNNRNVPKKFQIPVGTIIEAGGFKVFYEYQFNETNTEPFNLNSAHGGEVFLFKATEAGELLGFRRGIDFGASENGVSFGRWVNSQTNTDVVPMASLTFGSSITRDDLGTAGNNAAFRAGKGAPNRYPKVGPIVINEIHYHPPDIIIGITTNDNSLDEYVELHNMTGQAVPLFDPNPVYEFQGDVFGYGPTNTWRIRGGISFNFPTNISIPANGYLLVVNFDPTNTTALVNFTNQFGIAGYPDTVQVIGPYKGKLSNGGATVGLYKPDPPQGPPLHNDERGFVPYIHVDAIKYNDKAPWPLTPDGGGHSLQRLVSIDYGNDPAIWKGASPTAGRANTDVALGAPVITTDPSSQLTVSGSTVDLTVAATGSDLFYRWQFNGIQIDGATNATLHLVNVATNVTGVYRAVVLNAAGIAYSAPATLTVVQNMDDSIPPTVTITSPANNAQVTKSILTVRGTASDNFILTLVEVQVNDGEFVPATGTTSWSADVTLVPGVNTIRARSTDIGTNRSAVVTRTVTFLSINTVDLTIRGQGTVTGISTTKSLVNGQSYSIVAKPAPGFVFSNWTGDVSGVSPSLTFTMVSNLKIIATFVRNPFEPVSGTYNGLFYEDPEDPLSGGVRPESAGAFTFNLASKGGYTAQLQLGGRRYSCKGKLSLEGRGTNVINRAGLAPLTVTWAVALNNSDTISGTVSDGTWRSLSTGDRLTYHVLLNQAPQAGRYTFVVPGSPGAPNAPEGDSYGSIQVGINGVALIAGSLSEDIKFSQKSAVSKHGVIPLYFAPNGGRSLLTGWISLGTSRASAFGGDVTWMKPSAAGGRLYPAGFTNDATLSGSSYTVAGFTNRMLNTPTAALKVAGGDLDEPFTNGLALALGGKITGTGPYEFNIKVVPTTGLFRGTLTPLGAAAGIKFAGAMLQSSTNAAGYLLGTNRVGRVSITAP